MERFDAYVERCLYDPTAGFYAAGRGVAGRRTGDFLTSPEVGPLFGAVLARSLDAWWDELSRPDPYIVVDAGAGPGSLLAAVARATPRCGDALQPIGVDPATRTTLPDDLTGAIVIANELLDNLAFRVAVFVSGRWHEVFVRDGAELLQPLDDPTRCEALHREPSEGERMPLLDAARNYINMLQSRGAARVISFDYGTLTTSELATRGGWLRTYREHQRGSDPYEDPGAWDITTDIAVDQLPTPTSATTQAGFLRSWGIEQLVAEGVDYWHEHAANPDVAALVMRSRVAESAALLDPAGLGSWLCLEWAT